MSGNKIILVGGGGHCASVIDVIEQEGRFEIAGILDRKNIGSKVLGYPIIASDEDLERIAKEYKIFLVTVGHIASNKDRVRLFERVRNAGATPATIISPRASVSKHATIGEGTVVMHNAVVNSRAKIGDNTIINTGSIVEHDVTIGDHCHISTGASINGVCKIGNHVFIGSNATLRQEISVADRVVVGAGAVVVGDLSIAGTYIGNPAKARSLTDRTDLTDEKLH